MPSKHIVMFSGGIGSWMTARRVKETYGNDDIVLVFADTMMEDDDLYRFLNEAAADIGGELVILADGRDPWQVFHDVRFLGNSRIDPCSRVLKRELIAKWLKKTYDPTNCIIYLGMTWMEDHRFTRAQRYWTPWTVAAPMCDKPYLLPEQMMQVCRDAGIAPPRLYSLGFNHNNCGGFCIKAGLGHFYKLLKTMPERYAYHEQKEIELGKYLGKRVTILRDRTGGESTPLSMTEFRERIESGGQCDMFDLGGCGCFSPDEDE